MQRDLISAKLAAMPRAASAAAAGCRRDRTLDRMAAECMVG
jgi:hypothetical protein